MYHEHPLKILKNALKNIWLLIFPLLRGIKTIKLDIDVLYNWISGAWFDLLVILLIIGFGFIRWAYTWIRFDENEVSLISGIFVKRETIIPYANISAAASVHPFFLRPFKAVKMTINTCGGAFKKSDMTLLLKRSDAGKLRHKFLRPHDVHHKTFEIRPGILTIIFFSFVFSSSLSGALYISTFFIKLGNTAKELYENELKSAIDLLTNEVSSKFALSIPPAAIALGILVIVTWLFSFVSNILRYAGFSMKREKNFLEVRMGALTRRSYHIVSDKINYVDMRQSMIMKIFRKTSLNISCSGYGGKKNELPVLFPVLSKNQANRALDLLDFGKKIGKRKVSANRAAVMTFLGIPLMFCAGIPLASVILIRISPRLSQFIIPFAIMAEVPSIWLLVIKTMALFMTGISIDNGFVCIRYSRSFTFHTVMADKRKLVKIQIVQNPIQKKLKRCRLDFYFSSETPKANRLHGINITDAEKLLKILIGKSENINSKGERS